MHPTMRPTVITAAALLALAAPLATACSSSQGKTATCASVAGSIGAHLASLEKAVATYGNDPHDAATAIRQLQSDIDEIAGKTGNAAATKAINELSTGLDNAKDDLDNGVKPDIKPIADAAAAFAKSCVPGSSAQTG
ncbi:hypothetical protein NGB36_25300 [Streptomyces sp. RB6PN25]|uniref:Secreted protein n=1 Tax=Streptomyces humicola TaxID=2953240 RepID=A0ABT1Q1N0_9ACTN|nr:hypothetical protein [Streptomyces humicola]MCQ4083817.1 hypothetical protein [Streptomyces humicola]